MISRHLIIGSLALVFACSHGYGTEPLAPTAEYQDHERAVLAMAFSPDGNLLASGGEDRRLVVRPLRQESADATEVARWRQRIRELDHNRFQVRQQAHEALALLGPEVVPDLEANLKSSPSSEVRRRIDQLLRRHRQPTGVGHEGVIRDLAFSPDGTTIVTAGHDDSVRFWIAATGKAYHVLRAHSDGVWSVQYSLDGRRLFTGGGDNRIAGWDTVTYQSRFESREHASTVQALAMSPDGMQIASAGGFDGTIGLTDVETGKGLASLDAPHDSVICVAYHPTESILVSGGYGRTVAVWDLRTQMLSAEIPVDIDIIRTLTFSRDGQWLAVGGKSDAVRVIRWAGRETTWSLPNHRGAVFVAVFAPDANTLATADEKGTIRMWAIRD